MIVRTGDIVKWSNGRKPLGTVVNTFEHRGHRFAVVENETKQTMIVVRVYEKLEVVK